jgi:hypothetical protein
MRVITAQPPAALVSEIAAQCSRSVPADTRALVAGLLPRFGESLVAVILYGSCMRAQHYREGIVDLYVIVDSYKKAYKERHLRYLNAWLPPNVFYMETSGQDSSIIRIKYTVISLGDLKRGCTTWFHSYLWSRFAQPVRILYASNRETRDILHDTSARAALTFLRTTLPALGRERVDAEAIWINGLSLTYASELRPERDRARYITHQNLGDFIRLTHCAAPALTDLIQVLPQGYYQSLADDRLRVRTLRLWRLRRWQGRVLSVLRLSKAVFTFRDCVDYAAWKIQRHTGIRINVTPGLQRHPILFGFSVLWRLLRRDALR